MFSIRAKVSNFCAFVHCPMTDMLPSVHCNVDVLEARGPIFKSS